MKPFCALAICLAIAGAAFPAGAETLLVQRVAEEARVALPERGLTMAQVEKRFGAPAERLEPRGGQRQQWPAIHRWVYPAFTVYFEKSKVIDAVLNRADANEIGPKPAIR
ncbi:hypothetical protein ACFFGH_07860 [Lysobacter korlensis]|uniref:Lipoprotein SmpA/OmlA domain-containing protein n=1 Tax=Lysobacter korlensis TaxID=553636 RepID=A0ABV6RL89_9GAMM